MKDEEIDALALAVANELREQYRKDTRQETAGDPAVTQEVEAKASAEELGGRGVRRGADLG